MMQEFEELVPSVEVHASQCPEPVIISGIRSAVTQLCEDCRVWRTTDCYERSKPATTPELVLNGGHGFIFEIESVSLDHMPLRPATLDDVKMWRGARSSEDGVPQFYTQEFPGTLILFPMGDGGGILRITGFKKPKPNETMAPDYIMSHYRSAIIHGALSSVLAIPSQPWSNAQLASYYAQSFANSIGSKAYDFALGQQRGTLRTGRHVRDRYF